MHVNINIARQLKSAVLKFNLNEKQKIICL